MSTIPCHRGGHHCSWPACPADCDGRPGSVAPTASVAVIRLLTKIADLVDDEDACEPLDDAIHYANEALALIRAPAQATSLTDAIKVIRAEPCPFKDGPMADGWAEAWATFLNRLGDVDGTNGLYANSSAAHPPAAPVEPFDTIAERVSKDYPEMVGALDRHLASEAAGKRPVPSVSGNTHREQQRDTTGVTAGETANNPGADSKAEQEVRPTAIEPNREFDSPDRGHFQCSADRAKEALHQAKFALTKIRACSIAGCEEGYGKPEKWADALFASHGDVAAALKKIDEVLK